MAVEYSFSPHERRVIMSALEFVTDYLDSSHRIRLSNYERMDTQPAGVARGVQDTMAEVLNRFAEDTCWDKFEGEA